VSPTETELRPAAGAEERAEDGVIAGIDAWKRSCGQAEPVPPSEECDMEVADVADEDLQRWELWLSEDGAL
jgi:hypothetical protein